MLGYYYEEARRFTMDLEQRVADRTEQLEREHHRAVALLSITSELISTLNID